MVGGGRFPRRFSITEGPFQSCERKCTGHAFSYRTQSFCIVAVVAVNSEIRIDSFAVFGR